MRINISEENILRRLHQSGSVNQLAIFRILLGSQIYYSSSSQLLNLLQVVDGTTGTKNIFPSILNDVIAKIAVPYLQTTTQLLSIFLIFGLFTRYILPILFLSFLFLFSFWYSKFNAPVPWLYIWYPLLILNFSKCSDALSLDKIFGLIKPLNNKYDSAYKWPVELVAAWFAYIYFAAGIAKIIPIQKCYNWIHGGTGQEIIYYRFLDSNYFYIFGSPIFDYTRYNWIFSLLSVGSLIIELSCVLIFFTNRFNNFLIILVLLMHFFLYLTGVPGFMQTALILSICLINPDKFNRQNNIK